MFYALHKHDNSNLHYRFLVGRNLDGCWIVCDRKRLVGGLFADKESAMNFAAAESDHLAGAVWCADENECLLADPWSDLSVIAPTDRSNHIATKLHRHHI
ncbi:hypothetical protein [Phyllobacterium sp. 628]|uniref:hypothetical protein n=1 Tax=Phyllobacterium sp. 628 TaxID=2718938 RepID=UPI0016622745|nr:hypothetical protein [Phyllobacterium sp. 628]